MAFTSIRETVNRLSPHITGISHKLSGRMRITVNHDSDRVEIVVSNQGRPNKIKHVKPSDLPWECCNPFRLAKLACNEELNRRISASWARIDQQASSPTQSIALLREMAFLSPEEDLAYYSISLIANKLLQRKISKDQIPKAIETLKWLVLSAVTEHDVPKIAFLNGYLCLLGSFDLTEIELLWPGMTTDNLVGDFSHILRLSH